MPPAWVEHVPLAGPKIAATWREYAAQTPDALAAKLGALRRSRLEMACGGGRRRRALVVQFLLTIVIAAVMYSGGEAAALGVRKFGARFARQAGRGRGLARRPGDPRRRARRRGHRPCPGAPRRAGSAGGGLSLRGRADRRHAAVLYRPARTDARPASGDDLDVLDRRQCVGNRCC